MRAGGFGNGDATELLLDAAHAAGVMVLMNVCVQCGKASARVGG